MKLLSNFLKKSENQYLYEKKDLTNIRFCIYHKKSKYKMLTINIHTTKYDKN